MRLSSPDTPGAHAKASSPDGACGIRDFKAPLFQYSVTLHTGYLLTTLPLDYFPWIAPILLGYAILTQAMKDIFARRYGWR
ncbi:MAG: hypothetical protein L0Y39_11320 [Methylococcaceae bacterium]|nr:hypothetical protein [Methylococcaceae bacterium]